MLVLTENCVVKHQKSVEFNRKYSQLPLIWCDVGQQLSLSNNLVPRVSLLSLPWSLEEKSWLRLVTEPPVKQTFPPEQRKQIISVNLNRSERKVIASHTLMCKYTFEILLSYCKLHTGQMKYIYLYSVH